MRDGEKILDAVSGILQQGEDAEIRRTRDGIVILSSRKRIRERLGGESD